MRTPPLAGVSWFEGDEQLRTGGRFDADPTDSAGEFISPIQTSRVIMIGENGLSSIHEAQQPASNHSGWGGRRPGAGRKPKAVKTLQSLTSSDDASYAVHLVASLMRDETQPPGLRFDAAREILNWALGKPSALLGADGQNRDDQLVHALTSMSQPLANGHPGR